MSTAIAAMPIVPQGKIKTFDALGPKYEVGKLLYQLPDGDWMICVLLVETGEHTEYRLSHLNEDPEAV